MKHMTIWPIGEVYHTLKHNTLLIDGFLSICLLLDGNPITEIYGLISPCLNLATIWWQAYYISGLMIDIFIVNVIHYHCIDNCDLAIGKYI